jgi:hypothetical protein
MDNRPFTEIRITKISNLLLEYMRTILDGRFYIETSS